MKLLSTFSVLSSILSFALATDYVATPWSSINWDEHQYIAPTATDLRSPCPGINTLANHGFVNRNGRDITIPDILQAGLDVYNFHPSLLGLAAKVALTTNYALNSTFTFEDVRLHDSIEHDASISRTDFFTGNNWSFNATIYNSTMAKSNPGVDYYNASSTGLVMRDRLLDSNTTNPTLINTSKEIGIRAREASLALTSMGNVTSGVAPKQFVDIFFREERLPLAEGWKRSEVQATPDTSSVIEDILFEYSEWVASGQCPSIPLIVSEGVTLMA